MSADVNGAAHDGLLERNAQDIGRRRPAFHAPTTHRGDGRGHLPPASATGGFLLAAYKYVVEYNPLQRADLQEFVHFNHASNRHARTPTWLPDNPQGPWRQFTCDELQQRVKLGLDVSWLRDDSL